VEQKGAGWLGKLVQISENSATVTPYGSLGNVHQTVSSDGRGQRDTARHRARVRLIMRALTGAVIGTLIALSFACSAARADWALHTVQDYTADADESDVDARAIGEQDDASLIVTCVGKSKLLAIAFHEPRANWQRGEAMLQATAVGRKHDRADSRSSTGQKSCRC